MLACIQPGFENYWNYFPFYSIFCIFFFIICILHFTLPFYHKPLKSCWEKKTWSELGSTSFGFVGLSGGCCVMAFVSSQTVTEKHKLNVPETMTEVLDVSDEEGESRCTQKLVSIYPWRDCSSGVGWDQQQPCCYVLAWAQFSQVQHDRFPSDKRLFIHALLN